jgi:predicted permease
VLSLALGVGAGVAAFSVVDSIRFRALPFLTAERLVVVSEVPATGVADGSSCRLLCDVAYTTFANVLREFPFRSADVVAGYTSGGKVLTVSGEQVPVTAGVLSPNVFALLGARPALGRVFAAADDKLGAEYTAVLSHRLWTTHFGQDPTILGRAVKFSDTQYTIIGVMEPGFEFEAGSDLWLPVVPTLDPSTRPSIRSLSVFARLAPGRTIDHLRGELAAIELPLAPSGGAPPTPMTLTAAPLRERYIASTQSHDVIFAVLVGCVLLIACANLANLSLVRTLGQQRELAVRFALGAGARRLARYLVAQHVLIVAAAMIVGLLFASWLLDTLRTLPVMNAVRPAGMEFGMDLRAIAFALALGVLVVLVLSAIPVRLVTRSDTHVLLREGAPSGGMGRSGSRTQQLFVVAQIGSAFVLLTGAGLLGKSVLQLSRVSLGFETASLVRGTPSLPHPWRVKEKYMPVTEQIVAELRTMPGVSAVGVRATLPLGGRGTRAAVTPDGATGPLAAGLVPASAVSVSPDYFTTLGIRTVRGRTFQDADVDGGLPVAVVNDWAARRWFPGGDAVGRLVRVDTAPGLPITLTIVGVIADNKAAQPNVLFAEDGPELYRPFVQASSAFPSFYVRANGPPAPLLRPMREILMRLVPDRPVFASPVADDVARQLAGVEANAIQTLGVAGVGLFLALLGVHGVLAYAVRRRTREFGIRGAIGATRGKIAGMVLRDATLLTVGGLALGLPAALAASRLIAELLFGTSARDPVVYTVVASAVALVAIAAAVVPALRATRVAPTEALRS